jgi:IstB-like ATP binding protein
MTGTDMGRRLAVLLPGFDPSAMGAPLTAAELAARDREALAEAQGQARADIVQTRVEHLLAARPPYFGVTYPAPDDAVAWAERLGRGERPGALWLGGVHGSGKTTVAWQMAEYAVRSGFAGQVLVVKAGDLWETLAPPVDTVARRRYAEVDLLILDDLAKGGLTEWNRGHLHWIVDQRIEWQRPMIITSEAKLKGLVDPATWSRLGQVVTPVWLGTWDYRLGREITGEGE